MYSSKTWGKSKGGLKLFKTEASWRSKSVHDLTSIDCAEAGDKYCGKKPGIKLSDIWNNRPTKNAGSKTKSQSEKNVVDKFYVTQFVREKENVPKKQQKIVKKTQTTMNSEEKALEREAHELYRELLEIVKKNSAATPVGSELGEPVPVGILKNKKKDQAGKDRGSSTR